MKQSFARNKTRTSDDASEISPKLNDEFLEKYYSAMPPTA